MSAIVNATPLIALAVEALFNNWSYSMDKLLQDYTADVKLLNVSGVEHL